MKKHKPKTYSDELTEGITDHFGRVVTIKHPAEVISLLLDEDRQLSIGNYTQSFLFDIATSIVIVREFCGGTVTYSLAFHNAIVELPESQSLLAAEAFLQHVQTSRS